MNIELESLSRIHRDHIDRQIKIHERHLSNLMEEADYWYRFDKLLRDKQMICELDGATYQEFFERIMAFAVPSLMVFENNWTYKGHKKDVIQRYFLESQL